MWRELGLEREYLCIAVCVDWKMSILISLCDSVSVQVYLITYILCFLATATADWKATFRHVN